MLASAVDCAPTRLFALRPWQERSTAYELVVDAEEIEPHGRPLSDRLTRTSRDPRLRAQFGVPAAAAVLQPRPITGTGAIWH